MDSTITNLTALATIADGDLLPIVDVSDTTMSANGTTKKITKANLVSDLSTDITTLETTNSDGWIELSETWTRTGNHTFTVATDLTSRYRKGAKVRYKDGGSYEYGYIISSSYSAPNTTVTLATNTNYTMAATTITVPAISYIENPVGFPYWLNYTPTLTGFSGTPTISYCYFRIIGDECTLKAYIEGTSNSTSFIMTTPNLTVNGSVAVLMRSRDNGTYSSRMARATSAEQNIRFFTTFAGGGWTSSGTKSAEDFIIWFRF